MVDFRTCTADSLHASTHVVAVNPWWSAELKSVLRKNRGPGVTIFKDTVSSNLNNTYITFIQKSLTDYHLPSRAAANEFPCFHVLINTGLEVVFIQPAKFAR